jgi:glycosyltransferase involved in cell wall biosynthesis
LIARRADVFVAVSAEDKRRMTSVEGIPADMIELIPNGIADPPPSDARSDVRVELGIAPNAPVIGTVATLRHYKGVDVLLRAAALLIEDLPQLQVLVAGGDEGTDTTVRRDLNLLAGELGIADNVRLLGFRDDVPAVVAAFDVAVCSSDFEGSPLSVLEYMEEAKPVVATAVGGLPDLVTDGEQGYLVPVRNPERLAQRIGELLADPDAAQRMGEAGRKLRRAKFGIDGTVAKIEALYERLAARG